MKIVFVQLLNNFSGSPNVLSIIIKEFVKRGYEVELFTSKDEGFLSDLAEVKYHHTLYRWTNSRIITLLRFLIAQCQLFFYLLFGKRSGTVYYINTVLPFGAALVCKLSLKKMVYHCHEDMTQHKPLYGIYRTVYKWVNQSTVFVSGYVKQCTPGCRDSVVAYNGLSHEFIDRYSQYRSEKKPDNILMICSLRRYKGIYEFIEIGRRLPYLTFQLVVSDSAEEVDKFKKKTTPSPNIQIYSRQNNLHPFYANAKILLSLSTPGMWVETFGLTILEAMVYGVPAIVPNVGGPAELVLDGYNGYTLNPLDIDEVVHKIRILTCDKDLYERFSMAAYQRSALFSVDNMMDIIENYIHK